MRFMPSVLTLLMLTPTFAVAAAECDDYLAEAEAVSGVAPRFNDDGSFRSLVSYATSSFLAPKQSLIDSSRTLAEIQAKKNIAAWMEERFSADSAAATSLTQVETTDAEGNTIGKAEEMTALAEAYRANSDAVLNGVVKLDECVDPDAKVLYLALGWKPDAPQTTAAAAAPASEEAAAPSATGLTTVHIEVEGIGPDQTIAINDGLRLAVSQVYGEHFAATVAAASLVNTAETTDSGGGTTSSSLVGQSVSASTASTTSGVISSYRVLELSSEGQNVRVRLTVDIPRYQPAVLGKALKLIVLPPRPMPEASAELAPHLGSMQREIETLLTQARGLNILNRENVPSLDAELGAIATEGSYRVEELAKLGNRLGADLVLITEVGRFDVDRQTRKMGARNVETVALRGEVWVKVVDVVTSATVFAIRIPAEQSGLAASFDLGSETMRLADTVAQAVGDAVGSGFPPEVAARLDAATAPLEPAPQTDAKPKIDAVKEGISDDW